MISLFSIEFPFEEALRIFEVLSPQQLQLSPVLNSQYLELNSDRALVVTDKVIAKEFEMDGECSFNLRIIIMYCTCMYVQLGSGSLYTYNLPTLCSPLHACIYSPMPAWVHLICWLYNYNATPHSDVSSVIG